MQKVGVRELKQRTSELLRRVRTEGAAFEITYYGRVVARLTPSGAPDTGVSWQSFWDRWDQLTRDIAEHWPENVSAVDAVREGRREL